MNEELLKAVLANPDDDSPRLALADWLEENGQAERGEFIQVQIALAGMKEDFCPCDPSGRLPGSVGSTKKTCDCSWCSLRRRELELLNTLRESLSQELLLLRESLGASLWVGVRLRYDSQPSLLLHRGFVQSVICTAASWLAHADAFLASQPVREVTLTTRLQRSFVKDKVILSASSPESILGVSPFGCRRAKRPQNGKPVSITDTLAAEWPGITFHLPATDLSQSVNAAVTTFPTYQGIVQ